MAKGKSKKSKKPSPPSGLGRIPPYIWQGAGAIIVMAILIYLPAVTGGFIWDDPDYVVNNHTLRDLPGLAQIWTEPHSIPQWYPLTHTTFWIEYHLWQLHPLGYHLDNVLLHIGSSFLLWRLLLLLEVPGAWLAAAIFAVHPMQVESVAWVTERKNVLSGFFALLSLLFYFKFSPPGKESKQPPKLDRFYALAFICFVASLMSKSVTAILPAVILVIFWWKRGRLTLRDLLPLLPFFAVGATYGLYTAYLEKHFVGASGEHIVELNLTFPDRLLIAGRAICFYAGKLLIPWPLVFIYPQWRNINPHIWWQWIFPVVVLATLIGLILNRNRLGRGPAAAVLIFCGMLFPAIGFLNVYPMRFSYVADHFQYHACIALIALAAAGLCRYTGKIGWAILAPLAVMTAMRTPAYHNVETLWRDTLSRNPDSWMVHVNLGKVLVERAQQGGPESLYDEAAIHFETAMHLAPNIHDTHTNVANVLARRGDFQGALEEFQKTLAIDPNFAPAHYGLGQVYERLQQYDKAAAEYAAAITFAPDYPLAHFGLAHLLEKQQDFSGAAIHYRSAVAGMPEDYDARYNLGSCLIRLREYSEAVGNLLQAVRIRPASADAWYNLGIAQMKANHPNDAAMSFERVLQLRPDFAPARSAIQQMSHH